MQAFQPKTLYKDPHSSTIVEIIQAFQPLEERFIDYLIYNSRNYTSLSTCVGATNRVKIYNSRNYASLSTVNKAVKNARSTIVEIMQAFQPIRVNSQYLLKSTIVEIMQAFQPCFAFSWYLVIYNSRNYASLSTLQWA